jgi:lipoic acid synthetase
MSTLEPKTNPAVRAGTEPAVGTARRGERGIAKTDRITRNRVIPILSTYAVAKPSWIRVGLSDTPRFRAMKSTLRQERLHTVCEEASCPNIGECFASGTATFMILGRLCTRRCPFCDVAHGRPDPPDPDEPTRLARTIARLSLRHVVITSVDRDDLRDGGADHFAACVRAVRQLAPKTRVELLVPDFRGRVAVALEKLAASPPDVLNHNIESVPRLYRNVRPGADYVNSLALLASFKRQKPDVLTKSGLMVGLGETDAEVIDVMRDLRRHHVDMLTLGQYLKPRTGNLPVQRYVTPEAFAQFKQHAVVMGFRHAACGPLVRSSYHAEEQASGVESVSDR